MKRSSLDLLCCPTCKTALTLKAEHSEAIIARGELTCSTCSRVYPIHDGIVEFIQVEDLEGPNRRFAGYYDRLSPFYSLFIKLIFLPFGGDRKARQEILKHLDLVGGRTLEVSIGTGANLPYLFESAGAGEIFGIDLSIGQLKQCRKWMDRRSWGVDLFLAKAEGLPFRDETFDNVLHIGGINFFTSQRKAIEEMARVARPGAKIVVADEVERLARGINRATSTSPAGGERTTKGTPIQDLVPESMQDIQVGGIWKFHGKFHGYCLRFSKPG